MKALKILVVEDDPLVAADIAAHLTAAGHSVVGPAYDATKALKLARQTPPDLAVVDIHLNDIKDAGIQLVQQLLNQYWLPFLYLTSSSDNATIQKAIATQPAAYLMKPYNPNELLVQVSLAHANASRLTPEGDGPHSDSLFLPLNKGHEHVFIDDIMFLEAKGSCVNVHLAGQAKAIMLGTHLGNMVQYFPDPPFYRLSRSLFINLDHLKRIERTTIQLGEERLAVEISEANRKELLKRIRVVRTK